MQSNILHLSEFHLCDFLLSCFDLYKPLDNAVHDVLVPDHGFPGSFVLVREFLPPAPHPLDQADQGLGGWHDVEGRRQGGARLEVADPQLRPRKLPLPGKGGYGDNQQIVLVENTSNRGVGQLIVCAFNYRGICVCVRRGLTSQLFGQNLWNFPNQPSQLKGCETQETFECGEKLCEEILAPTNISTRNS